MEIISRERYDLSGYDAGLWIRQDEFDLLKELVDCSYANNSLSDKAADFGYSILQVIEVQ